MLVAEGAIGGGEAAIDAALESERKLGGVGQREFQVVDRGLGLAEARRELGEHQSARKSAQHRIGGDAFIQLADGVLDPGHPPQQGDLAGHPRLHGGLQGTEERGAGRLLGRQPPEVGVALPLAVSGEELLHGRQDDDGLRVGIGRRLEQRAERALLGHGRLGGRRDAGAGGQEGREAHRGGELLESGHGVLLIWTLSR